MGLHGVCWPKCVKVPRDTAATRITRTAIGLRFQLFSPSPAKNGSTSMTRMPIIGAINKIGVSAAGGKNESTAYIQRKKESGFGAVWMMVGSGWPPGPKGPRRTAHTAMDNRMKPEKTMSFQIAFGTNGTPSFAVSS